MKPLNCIQGCPIYGKIRLLWIFSTCFSLRTKIWTNLRIFSYSVRLLTPPLAPPTPLYFRDSRYSTDKKMIIFFTNYAFFLTRFGYYPLFHFRDSRCFARGELTFSATTRNLRIFWNSDWATLCISYVDTTLVDKSLGYHMGLFMDPVNRR